MRTPVAYAHRIGNSYASAQSKGLPLLDQMPLIRAMGGGQQNEGEDLMLDIVRLQVRGLSARYHLSGVKFRERPRALRP